MDGHEIQGVHSQHHHQQSPPQHPPSSTPPSILALDDTGHQRVLLSPHQTHHYKHTPSPGVKSAEFAAKSKSTSPNSPNMVNTDASTSTQPHNLKNNKPPSHRKDKGKDVVDHLHPSRAMHASLSPNSAPASSSTTTAAASMSPETTTAQPPADSTTSSSLAFSAVALAQAKRDGDKRKRKDKHASKSSPEEDKEERRRRKETKRRRKEDGRRSTEEDSDDSPTDHRKGSAKRKRKSDEDGKVPNSSGKKHRDESSSKDKDKGKKAASNSSRSSSKPRDSIVADFAAAVSSFMNWGESSTIAALSPSFDRDQRKGRRSEEAARPPSSSDSSKDKTPRSKGSSKPPKTHKDSKGKGKALAPSSPLAQDPMAASSSPERHVMEMSPETDGGALSRSTPSMTPMTPGEPSSSRHPDARTSLGHTAAEIAAKWANRPAQKETPQQRKERYERTADLDAEVLRERLKDPAALHEFLSSRWIDIPVLQRLEKQGVLTWKRGKYTETEKQAVRDHLEAFARTHGLSHPEVVDIIMAKGRASARGKYPGFWAEVAAQVPGRPLRYVKEAVQRMYHPSAHKGTWTKEEDESLRKAYTEFPDQWVKIGDAVGRSYVDCRDRYKKQILGVDERTTGKWSKEEEDRLTEAVKQATAELGKDMFSNDVPWSVVSSLMGGGRTFHQCRVKWTEGLAPALRGAIYGVSPRDVLAAFKKFDYAHEGDIVWRDLANEVNSHSKGVQATWRRMLKAVEPTEGKSFSELLSMLDGQVDTLAAEDEAKAAAAADRARKAAERAEARARAKEKRAADKAAAADLRDHSRREMAEWVEAAGHKGAQTAAAWMDGLVAQRSFDERGSSAGLTRGSSSQPGGPSDAVGPAPAN